MVENRGAQQLDPTPNFDCHVSKNANVDVSAVGPLHAYESTQVRPMQLFTITDLNSVHSVNNP